MASATTQMLAVYRLPFAIDLTGECAGLTVATQIGGMPAKVMLPYFQWRGDTAYVAAPRLRSATKRLKWLTETSNDPWYWGSVYLRDTESQLVELWSATTILLQFSPMPSTEFSYSEYLYGRGHPRGKPVNDLYSIIDDWSQLLADWLEALVDQDANRLGPLTNGNLLGSGLTVWTREGSIESIPGHDPTIAMRMRAQEHVDRQMWRRLLRLVKRGAPVPDELKLVADARAWLRRHEYRRSVIDAGTAAELSLIRVLDQALTDVPEPIRSKVKSEHRSLGRLAELVECSPHLSRGDLKALVECRNKAAHNNESPTHSDATRAVSTAAAVVECVEPLATFR